MLRQALVVGGSHAVARDACAFAMIDEISVRFRYELLSASLDGRGRRLFAAAEARAAGHGGVAGVARATGLARSTIGRGPADLEAQELDAGKVRRAGGGRRPLTRIDATLLADLLAILEPSTLGDPMRPLLWVSKSHAKLAAALAALGHRVAAGSLPGLLEQAGCRRQANRKSLEGSRHPGRNAQFEHINRQAAAFQAAGQPVIPVDTKKKENVGEFKNAGAGYRARGCPDKVNVHDFTDKDLGKAIPYGVYDIAANAGYVSVGIDHDTAEFAVNSIQRWRETMGRERYPVPDRLMVTAGGGGSNGSRVRLWKIGLQKLAGATGLTLAVCHYPPGTSKWNKIGHRMFCHITQNRRGKPLTSRLAIVELIGATTTKTGLSVRCELDAKTCVKGIRASDEEMATLNITGDAFHPEWNYTIAPRSAKLQI